MRKEDLINNLKDLKSELIDPDIYKGAKVLDFLDTIDSAINLAEHIIPVCSSKKIDNEGLQFNTKDYENFIKEYIAYELAIYLRDKMDITICDNPLRHELTYTGKIYIYEKKKGV